MIKLSYGREDRLKQVKPGNGILRITSDTKKLFVDINYRRIAIGSVEDSLTAEEIQTLPREDIAPTFYASTDTGELFYYNFKDDKWSTVGTGSGGGTATSSDSAVKDGAGNVITDTYKTKAEAATEHDEFAEQIAALERTIANIGNTKYKTVDSVDDLPTNPTDEEKGFVWMVKTASGMDKYIWTETATGGQFQNMGSSDVDLSDYYNKAEVDAKVTTINGNINTIQASVETANNNFSTFASGYAIDKAAFENADTAQKKDITDIKEVIGDYPSTEGYTDPGGQVVPAAKTIAERLVDLEAKTDNDTVYDDTAITGRVAAIETQLSGAVLTDTVYDDAALTARVAALEGKEDKDTVYDDTALAARVTALENAPGGDTYDDTALVARVVALENAEDKDTVYDDSEVKGDIASIKGFIGDYPTGAGTKDIATRLTGLEGAIVSGGYDDTDLKLRIKALEDAEDKDTVYDDTALAARVTALENAPGGDTYDDTALVARVVALENAEDKDTVYDDTALAARVKALEDAPGGDSYDDTAITGRVAAIEAQLVGAILTDTVYDDTALAARVKALEDAPAGDSYDDTALVARVVALENAEDKDTVYDDTALAARVKALEDAEDKDTVYDDTALAARVKALEDAEDEVGDKLLAPITVTAAVGGIPANQTFAAGTSTEDILRMLLSPNAVSFPVIVEPTATLTASTNRMSYAASDTIGQVTFTLAFSQGSISTGGNRAGAATGYTINGEAGQTVTIDMDTLLPKDQTEDASVTIKGVVAFAAGDQPKDSSGANYGTALEAGTVESNGFTFTREKATAAPFSTTIYTNHIPMTEEEKAAAEADGWDWTVLDCKTSATEWFPEDVEIAPTVIINLPNGDEEDYPEWGKVAFPVRCTATHVWNPFYQVWDETPDEFVPSETTTEINGQTYYVYTDSRGYGGPTRETRFTLEWPPATP